jgi:hypothetical protein
MNRSTLVAFGFAAALALSAAPALAQHRRNGGGGEEGRDNGGAPRTENRQDSRPAPQAQAQPQSQPQQRQREDPRGVPRQDPRQDQRAVPREEVRRAPQYAVPREQYAAPRQQPQYAVPRPVAPRYDNRSYDNRSYDNRRYDGGRYYYGGSGRYYGPRYSGPRFSIAPRRFYRPYYAFRPRFSIGFGIWAGFPVTYYDPYYYPYDYYPYPSPGYPPQGSIGVQPYGVQGSMGGLSFDISPDDAEVWVDGNYMGIVGDFTASSQPLGLPSGRHHIELREPGFDVTSFDVDIIPGQVIPYEGQLQQ